ncbi:IS4/IS5 family transposase, partial [Anaerostipes hadrus]|nr:IS4/IS5 family transposase [Anaerostipes hadrus]NSG72033.1 IS4/IS5 family transposase [Anaerostipes hadrus]
MIMKYAQKVKKRYLTILNDMAKNRDSYVKNPGKDFTRKRKLSFQDTINTIVTYDAGSIGRCIKRYIPKVEKTPTTSAFLQQQKKLKLSAFQT